jgi:hypothetical protein
VRVTLSFYAFDHEFFVRNSQGLVNEALNDQEQRWKRFHFQRIITVLGAIFYVASPLLGLAVPHQSAVHDLPVFHGGGVEINVANCHMLAKIANKVVQALLKNFLIGGRNQFELSHEVIMPQTMRRGRASSAHVNEPV